MTSSAGARAAAQQPDRAPSAPARSALTRWLLARPTLHRTFASQPAVLGVLTLAAAGYTLGAVALPAWFPVATAAVWLLVGGFFLRWPYLLGYDVVVAAAVVLAVRWRSAAPPTPGVILTLVVIAALVLAYARSRERVGVQGAVGRSMLVDLRDRLRAQGTVPPLGPGWHVETELRSAYGDSFSGDFLVAARSACGERLEVVLVDVSGKGQPAGTRALLLSGAFGGLLGAMPREEFLPAANRYLMRQGWDEGFATAVHVALHLGDGSVEIRSAGHPPAAHRRGGTGRWEVVEAGRGPLLGVLPAPAFPAHVTRMQHGDALLLYTDGLVEEHDRDIALGIDRLVGVAEEVLTRGLPGGAVRIVEGTRAGAEDDRALVLLQRT